MESNFEIFNEIMSHPLPSRDVARGEIALDNGTKRCTLTLKHNTILPYWRMTRLRNAGFWLAYMEVQDGTVTLFFEKEPSANKDGD